MKAIFAHKQTYSRKGNSKSRSLADICAEAARISGAFPHVEAFLPPNILDGIDPASIPEIIDSRVNAQNSTLRKLRKKEPENSKGLRAIRVDTHLLVASIFSYPQSCEELEHDDFTEYNRWVKDVIAFARNDAEDNGLEVMSILEHLDEAHPHLHVLAMPLIDTNNLRINAKKCHEGHAAQDAHIATGAHGSPSRAYKQAMRSWQDKYHKTVGQRHGQARTGPKRRRLTRAQFQAEQALLEKTKDCAGIEDLLDQAQDTFIGRKKKIEAQLAQRSDALGEQQAKIEADQLLAAAKVEDEREAMLTALRAQRHALVVQTQKAEVQALMLQDKTAQLEAAKLAFDKEIVAVRKNAARDAAKLAVEIIAAVLTGHAGINVHGRPFITDPVLRERTNGLEISTITKDALQVMQDLWVALKSSLSDTDIVIEQKKASQAVKSVRREPDSGRSPF